MKRLLFFYLFISIVCCDLSTPPLMEEKLPSKSSRTIAEEGTKYLLSIYLENNKDSNWQLLKFGKKVTLPNLFLPIKFINSEINFSELKLWDTPFLIQDFYLIELFPKFKEEKTTENKKCIVTINSDNRATIHYSINNEELREYSSPIEVNTPTAVKVNSALKNEASIIALSAGISFKYSY
ncbi:MAG: hypothetical protein SOY52_08080 [Bullifex sp.]|nr:hypothetical protein [Bullifex sp.]